MDATTLLTNANFKGTTYEGPMGINPLDTHSDFFFGGAETKAIKF